VHRHAHIGKPMATKTQDLADARWDDVRVFLAVQRAGSLGQAAARLGVDTSTVSRRLTALESWLGARLFERTREGLAPTRVAELVLPPAEAMEAAHRRFARDASGVEAEAEGVVRLSVAPGFAQDFVAPALVRLRARHPKIRVELGCSRPSPTGARMASRPSASPARSRRARRSGHPMICGSSVPGPSGRCRASPRCGASSWKSSAAGVARAARAPAGPPVDHPPIR